MDCCGGLPCSSLSTLDGSRLLTIRASTRVSSDNKGDNSDRGIDMWVRGALEQFRGY